MAQLSQVVNPAAPAAAATDDTYFYLVIGGMTNAAHVPMSNSLFEFDGSANWRLELPSDILTTVTENKQQPLSICVYLSQGGVQRLGSAGMRMDVKACLVGGPPPVGQPAHAVDGTTPNYGWKTVGRLHPTLAVSAVAPITWQVAAIPHAVVLMVSAVGADSAPAFPVQLVLEDNAAAAGTPGSPGQQAAGGGAAGGGGGGAQVQHIATLPMTLISAFIGTRGSNVNSLRARYGSSCKINVDKETGMVNVSNCNNVSALYTEIQTFISTGGASAGGQQPMGGGRTGGGGGSRNRRGGNKGKSGGGGFGGGGFGGGGQGFGSF